MAEASSAQEATSPRPSRPASPLAIPSDERNDQTAGDESAPLLQTEANDGRRVTRRITIKFIHFWTSLALTSAVFALVVLIATSITMSAIPYGYQVPYWTRDAMNAIIVPVSDHRPRWFELDHLCQIGPILYLYMRHQSGSYSKESATSSTRDQYDLRPPDRCICDSLCGWRHVRCRRYWVWLQRLGQPIRSDTGRHHNGNGNHLWVSTMPHHVMNITISHRRALALISAVRLVHVILLLVRCRIAFSMESWRSPLSFPSGQLSFEVSIKFFREPQQPRQGGEQIV